MKQLSRYVGSVLILAQSGYLMQAVCHRVSDITVSVDIITIMKVTVDMYSFVIRVMWTSLCSVFVYGHTDTSYYADLGKEFYEPHRSNSQNYIKSISVSNARELDKEHLRGLYSKLNNLPELMNRRFQVGSKPPPVPVDTYSFQKRNSVDLLRAQPVCPYKTEWRLIHRAKNINDSEVIVFQPEIETDGFQWFYTATCDRTASFLADPECPSCCRGIDTTRYVSSCVPKKSYIMAYARQAQELNYDWTWIQIDTGCSCAISSRPGV